MDLDKGIDLEDKETLKVVRDKIQRKLAKKSFWEYVKYVNKDNDEFVEAEHIKYLADVMDKVERGILKRVMISLPPQHGKSATVTETFPSYYLGKNPDKRVMVTSYSDSLSKDFGYANKMKFTRYGSEVFNLNLDGSKKAKDNWGVEGNKGSFYSTTIMGEATGHSADILIIDDPLKGDEASNSKVKRDKVYKEYISSFKTRLSSEAPIVMIMTRWHEDDLIGRVLEKEESEGWLVINIPCISEGKEEDLLGREVGEALFDEIGKDKEWAKKEREAAGEKVWNSLYQGKPRPIEGTVIKSNWISYYDNLPEDIEEYTITVDMAFKGLASSDYTVFELWGRKGEEHFLIDMVDEKMDYPTAKEAFIRFCNNYPEATKKLVEDKANGSALIADVKGKIRGVIPVNPNKSKEYRVERSSALFRSGDVYIPKSKLGERFREEALAFPYGANDDRTDAAAQYLNDYLDRKDDNRVKRPGVAGGNLSKGSNGVRKRRRMR